MEFTIDARDQASKVVQSVQKKIESFGKDVGKSIAGVLGPMALAGTAVSLITNYLEDMKQKAKEAFDWGASLSDAAAKLGVNVEELQKINRAADATGESVDSVAKAFKLAADLIAKAKAGNADAITSLNALGISVEELGNTKPEDVLARLSGALAAGTDPADKMAIAMAALGSSAKDLQAVLAKGFDIQGAFQEKGDLTPEEQVFLRQAQQQERNKELRDKLNRARAEARKAFLATPEGKEFAAEVNRQGRLSASNIFSLTGGKTDFTTNEVVDAEIARRGAEKKAKEKAEAEARAADPKNKILAQNLRDVALQTDIAAMVAETMEILKKSKSEKEPEAKASKEPKGSKIGGVSNAEIGSISVKTPPLTVSSLREIGGGVAGERIGNQLSLAEIQVNISERMLQELEKINSRSGDFTKPPAGLGLTPGRMIA